VLNPGDGVAERGATSDEPKQHADDQHDIGNGQNVACLL
jgi:hypothetical protein